MYNVLVEWAGKGATRTLEPLSNLIQDDTVTIAAYAKDKKLTKKKGWQYPTLRRLYKSNKTFLHTAKQAKLQSFCYKPIYMYGYKVPRNFQQVKDFDDKNGNRKWQITVELKLEQINEYNTFKDMGEGYDPGEGCKRIDMHLVFAVKHDGCHQAHLVAGGHLTDTPINSVYSSVVSICGTHLLMFIGEHQGLKTWTTDIKNAYLES